MLSENRDYIRMSQINNIKLKLIIFTVANLVIMTIIVRFIVLFGLWVFLSSWGFYAHKRINETAVFLLPTEMSVFYKDQIRIITERAVDADKRCYVDTAEGPRHFIDLDRFEDEIDSIPIHWTKAKEKYTERKLLLSGVIPWQIYRTYQNLVQAFETKNMERIIRYSADLGHYVADAHVPLHTTSNYNGQYSNQIGIHAFWETRLPEMFSQEYDLFIGPAIYVRDPLENAWSIVRESNSRVDSVLNIEKQLSQNFKASEQKAYITRNNQLILTYSDTYATAYHDALQGMVERRFRASIAAVAAYWYSAWVDAGQPNWDFDTPLSDFVVEDEIPYEGRKTLGREEWH